MTQAFLEKCVIANKIKNVIDILGDLLSKYLSLSKDLIETKLKREIELWYEFWIDKDKIKSYKFPNIAIDTLKYCGVILYPCTTEFLKILST